jgi:hypothetical protein
VSGLVDAWRRWLSLEQEAVWTYPVIAARVAGSAAAAELALDAHRSTRDELLGLFANRHWLVPVTPASYAIGVVDTDAQAQTLAQSVEDRISAACVRVIEALEPTASADRQRALNSLRAAAAAQIAWGATVEALPGFSTR